jgi:hypothetical protein
MEEWVCGQEWVVPSLLKHLMEPWCHRIEGPKVESLAVDEWVVCAQ